jgi:hypothetical protein
MRAIEQRLAKLEQAGATAGMIHLWAEAGETTKQAIARQFAAGPAEKCDGSRVSVGHGMKDRRVTAMELICIVTGVPRSPACGGGL